MNIRSDIAACVSALGKITDDVVECGRTIADCCDRHPKFLGALAESCPGVSRTLLARLEKVGRGTLDPRVALGIEHGIFVERLSISDQKRVIDDGVEVAVGAGGADTMVMTLEQMDRTTAARVIRGATIASVKQQRSDILAQEDANRRASAKMERTQSSERSRARKVLDALPLVFSTKEKAVTIKREVKLTLPQLYLIIAELEGR